MCATWFANTWNYRPPQYRVGLEVNRNIKGLPNEIRSLESTGNAQNKKPHLRLINPICLSPL